MSECQVFESQVSSLKATILHLEGDVLVERDLHRAAFLRSMLVRSKASLSTAEAALAQCIAAHIPLPPRYRRSSLGRRPLRSIIPARRYLLRSRSPLICYFRRTGRPLPSDPSPYSRR
jgi:hypothetical protein